MTPHKDGDILNTRILDIPLRSSVFIWEYIQTKVEACKDSKLHFLPYEQCPACQDVGCVSTGKLQENHFYCSSCRTHWSVRYSEKERSNNGTNR